MLTEADIKAKYTEVIGEYLKTKPILGEVYKRGGNKHTDATLNEIRAANDHLARFYVHLKTPNAKYEELCKIEGHIKRLLYDAFKQLNIYFFDYANGFENANFGPHWLTINNGEFWSQYISQRKDIIEHIERAKIAESVGIEKAVDEYSTAYTIQQNVYKMIDENYNKLKSGHIKRIWHNMNSCIGWVLSTFILSIIPTMLWEIYSNWDTIIAYMLTSLQNTIHYIAQLVLGINII